MMMCCREDMCYYKDISIKIPLDARSDKSILGEFDSVLGDKIPNKVKLIDPNLYIYMLT